MTPPTAPVDDIELREVEDAARRADEVVQRCTEAAARAKTHLRHLQANVLDENVTARDLAAAEEDVELAGLRVQASDREAVLARRAVTDLKIERRRLTRRAEKAQELQRRRERWAELIATGAAARQIESLQLGGNPSPRFEPEYTTMLIKAGLLNEDGSVPSRNSWENQ